MSGEETKDKVAQEKQELLAKYCATRDVALRNALVEAYLYLSRAVAGRFSGRGVETEDLFQVASIALLHAVERFDCDKGLAFTTFAVPTIAGEVRNYIRDKAHLVRLPRRGGELLPRIAREREAFYQQWRREPSVFELAERVGVSQDHLLDALEMRASASPVSLDTAPSEEGDALSDFLGREEEAFAKIDSIDWVRSLLAHLEGKSRFVIEERFLRQRSQRDVARELGVSQMQVSRLERKALGVLRESMA